MLLFYNGVFAKPAVEPQPHHAKESLTEDAATHFAGAFTPVYEDNRNFLNLKAHLVGSVLHFYLEGIALEPDFVRGMLRSTLLR